MTREYKSLPDAGEASMGPAEMTVNAASLNNQTAESDRGLHILSASALAAAVAAVALPLVKIKGVEAEMVYCGADHYGGFDTGSLGDCKDCILSALAADCSFSPPDYCMTHDCSPPTDDPYGS